MPSRWLGDGGLAEERTYLGEEVCLGLHAVARTEGEGALAQGGLQRDVHGRVAGKVGHERRQLADEPGRGLTRVDPSGDALLAAVGERRFEVDAVLMGYGFMPSNELLRALAAGTISTARAAISSHIATRIARRAWRASTPLAIAAASAERGRQPMKA